VTARHDSTQMFFFFDQKIAGRTAHENFDRAAVRVRFEIGEVPDILWRGTDEKRNVRPNTVFRELELARELFASRGRGFRVRHFEHGRHSAENGAACSGFEIFFVRESRFAKVNL